MRNFWVEFCVNRTNYCQDTQHFLFWLQPTGSCSSITWAFFGLSKFFLIGFVREGPLSLHAKCCADQTYSLGGVWKSSFHMYILPAICTLPPNTHVFLNFMSHVQFSVKSLTSQDMREYPHGQVYKSVYSSVLNWSSSIKSVKNVRLCCVLMLKKQTLAEILSLDFLSPLWNINICLEMSVSVWVSCKSLI